MMAANEFGASPGEAGARPVAGRGAAGAERAGFRGFATARSEIVLATLNARYLHTAFGLRYLLANLGPLRPRATLLEFDIHQRPLDVVEALLAPEPRIIGLGVYIWNARETTEVVAALKRLRPDVFVVLGGPEVSFETDQQEVARLADYVITGEGDLTFARLCEQLLGGRRPSEKIITAELPEVTRLALPYEFYTDEDVAQRLIYVEASRGCPFTCEFCLSSLEVPVRAFPLGPFLEAMQRLLDRGVRHFKFVDRTFNLHLGVSRAILEFFRARYQPGLFLHFEMIPDRLPEPLREVIAGFPAGALQFEIGIQSFNAEVCALIRRRQDLQRTEENFRFLREHTGVHLHADLIAGLPGETLESFAAGFDRLVALGPQEIQVGVLKRLRGTPIGRHDTAWQMTYSPLPPYEILQNKLIDFGTMQRLRRFARYWDLVANSGNFVASTPLIWTDPAGAAGSPFWAFWRFSEWLFGEAGRTHDLALVRLAEWLFRYLTQVVGHPPAAVAEVLRRDYQRGGRTDVPRFLRAPGERGHECPPRPARGVAARRQARHLAGETAATAGAAPKSAPAGGGNRSTLGAPG